LSYRVEPLAPELSFGRVVRGLTFADIRDEATRAALRDLWIQHGVLVFREGEISDRFQIDLSQVFGPLERHPVKEVLVEGNPDLIVLKSVPGDVNIVEIDGEEGGGWIGWHSDLIYHGHINHGGLLRALQVTSRGGVTGFIDQIDAYDRLPQAMMDRIEGLSVVYQLGPIGRFPHAYKSKVRIVRMAPQNQQLMDRAHRDFAPVAHPLVFAQPETGRKVLNLSPLFALYIEGMRDAEGDALLADLAGHILDSPAYHHRWTLDDMVLWDNWRMLHSVSAVPLDETRIVQRTTIAGDYALGRTLSFKAA
jgi:taurine dioxygenase